MADWLASSSTHGCGAASSTAAISRATGKTLHLPVEGRPLRACEHRPVPPVVPARPAAASLPRPPTPIVGLHPTAPGATGKPRTVRNGGQRSASSSSLLQLWWRHGCHERRDGAQRCMTYNPPPRAHAGGCMSTVEGGPRPCQWGAQHCLYCHPRPTAPAARDTSAPLQKNRKLRPGAGACCSPSSRPVRSKIPHTPHRLLRQDCLGFSGN